MSKFAKIFYLIISWSLLISLLVIVAYPVFWMLMTSMKSQWQIFADPFSLPESFNLSNYQKAWNTGKFWLYFQNSIIITGVSIIGLLLMSSMAGYAFGRLKFKGNNILFLLFLTGMMIPPQAIIIPLYHWLSSLGLLDNMLGIIFAYLSWTSFGILILRSFFRSIPNELEDAARIDGCSEIMIFWRIMLPLVIPGLVTVGIFLFVWIWNDFLYPLIILQSPDKITVPLGVMSLKDQFTVDWGLQTAALSIATLPPLILYGLFQKKFIKGLTAGAIK